MQPPFVDPASLFRLVHFFDILAAVVFAVSVLGVLGLSDFGAAAEVASLLAESPLPALDSPPELEPDVSEPPLRCAFLP